VSTVVRPSGPLPRRVYWVRRLLLILVVLALVWGVTRLVASTASGDQAGADPSPAVEEIEEAPTATATPTDEPRLSKRDRRRERIKQERQEKRERREARQAEREANRARTVSAVLPPPEGACDLTQVSVLPSVPTGYEAGGTVDLRLAFSTLQPVPCSLDLDADRLLLLISADDEQVWTSTRCRDAIPEQSVVLRPFWTASVQVPWTGQRTGDRCSPRAAFAASGQYQLHAAVLTGEPAATEFTLLEPPPPPKPWRPKEPSDDEEADEPPDDEPPDDEEPSEPESQTGGAPEPGDEELSSND